MGKRVRVWRRSTGERLPLPLPERLVDWNPDLTTQQPDTELVEDCCGGDLVEVAVSTDNQGEEEWQD